MWSVSGTVTKILNIPHMVAIEIVEIFILSNQISLSGWRNHGKNGLLHERIPQSSKRDR